MKLSDRDIIARLEAGDIGIEPRPLDGWVRGASVDLRLGNTFRVFSNESGAGVPHIDLTGESAEIAAIIDRCMSPEIVVGDDQVFYLHPGELALGATLERLELPDSICGSINGRSSLARLGLMVHATAHFVDPGWRGQIVLEFFNCGRYPLGLKPGMRVCAISFEPLTSPALYPYASRRDAKYRDQLGATVSRLGFDVGPPGRA
jgi:dCTP deaminase